MQLGMLCNKTTIIGLYFRDFFRHMPDRWITSTYYMAKCCNILQYVTERLWDFQQFCYVLKFSTNLWTPYTPHPIVFFFIDTIGRRTMWPTVFRALVWHLAMTYSNADESINGNPSDKKRQFLYQHMKIIFHQNALENVSKISAVCSSLNVTSTKIQDAKYAVERTIFQFNIFVIPLQYSNCYANAIEFLLRQ